jgi:hypothetical protein
MLSHSLTHSPLSILTEKVTFLLMTLCLASKLFKEQILLTWEASETCVSCNHAWSLDNALLGIEGPALRSVLSKETVELSGSSFWISLLTIVNQLETMVPFMYFLCTLNPCSHYQCFFVLLLDLASRTSNLLSDKALTFQ